MDRVIGNDLTSLVVILKDSSWHLKRKKKLIVNLWKIFAKIFQYHFFCDLYKKNFKLGSQKSAWMECCRLWSYSWRIAHCENRSIKWVWSNILFTKWINVKKSRPLQQYFLVIITIIVWELLLNVQNARL